MDYLFAEKEEEKIEKGVIGKVQLASRVEAFGRSSPTVLR